MKSVETMPFQKRLDITVDLIRIVRKVRQLVIHASWGTNGGSGPSHPHLFSKRFRKPWARESGLGAIVTLPESPFNSASLLEVTKVQTPGRVPVKRNFHVWFPA